MGLKWSDIKDVGLEKALKLDCFREEDGMPVWAEIRIWFYEKIQLKLSYYFIDRPRQKKIEKLEKKLKEEGKL